VGAARIAVFLLLLGACTVIGHDPAPPGWPKLEERVIRGDLFETHLACGGSAASFLVFTLFGCATIQLAPDCKGGTCTIYVAGDDEYSDLTLEHEREHCAGRDHLGSTLLRDYLTMCLAR
jgi:hypothetical protein